MRRGFAVRAYDRKAKLSSDNELLKIAFAEAQGIQHSRLTALKGLILHLDAGEAVIADIRERGDEAPPIHIAETGELGRHEVQRMRP